MMHKCFGYCLKIDSQGVYPVCEQCIPLSRWWLLIRVVKDRVVKDRVDKGREGIGRARVGRNG